MSRTWLITGAAAGFGRELTERLPDRGERVAATARTPERLDNLAATHGSVGGRLYHATKWGAEGFFESIAGEVAAFGVEITLVEPGAARTGFGRALMVAGGLEAYAGTPVGQLRAYIESAGDLTGQAPGDPGKITQAIIDSADTDPGVSVVARSGGAG